VPSSRVMAKSCPSALAVFASTYLSVKSLSYLLKRLVLVDHKSVFVDDYKR
jgi:hypothetical protein